MPSTDTLAHFDDSLRVAAAFWNGALALSILDLIVFSSQ
jgi:hypothetical protein